MSKGIDMLGQKFGRLTVVARAENGKDKHRRWHCKCECGGETIAWTSSLRRGRSKSCGCLHSEAVTHALRRRLPNVQGNERWDNLAEFDEWPS
jgi:hypothetical protein